MPAGDVSFKVTDLTVNLVGAQVVVYANAAKYIVDDVAGQNTIGVFSAQTTYPLAGFGAVTMATIKADIVAALKAQYAALGGKVIS